jgi:hypothetical protein
MVTIAQIRDKETAGNTDRIGNTPQHERAKTPHLQRREARCGPCVWQGKLCDRWAAQAAVNARFTPECENSSGNPAIRGGPHRYDAATRGPEALRRRLSTVMPLFDTRIIDADASFTYAAGPHRSGTDGGKVVRAEE